MRLRCDSWPQFAAVTVKAAVDCWPDVIVTASGVAGLVVTLATVDGSGARDAGGQPSSTVYRGTLAADGTVSNWVETTALPVPLHSMGAVIFHGDLYVAGGSTTGNAPAAAVYRSRIDTSGTLGAWQTEAALPFARAHAGLGAFGGYLFTFGGDSGPVAPNGGTLSSSAIADVASAPIDLRTGDLTSAGWTTNANKLKKAVTKHTAVVAGGDVLITAGTKHSGVFFY